MKMILLLNCSGSHCISFINSWISSRSPNVVNPVNIFHSNSIGSTSIRFKSCKWLLSKYHLIYSFQASFGFSFRFLPDSALSRRRRRSWHLRSDECCHTASLSRSMCTLRNQSLIHQWSLCGSSVSLNNVLKNSRNDSWWIVNSDHRPDQDEQTVAWRVVFINIHRIAAFTLRSYIPSVGPRLLVFLTIE